MRVVVAGKDAGATEMRRCFTLLRVRFLSQCA